MNKTALIATKCVIDRLGPEFNAITGCGAVVAAKNTYKPAVSSSNHIITWGVKMPISWYRGLEKKKSFLYIENGLLKQRHGIYIDPKGWFGDSSIRQERDREPTQQEIENLRKFIQTQFGVELYEYKGRSGPILFAAQMRRDMGPRYYSNGNAFEKLYKNHRDDEVVIRPHPREKLQKSRVHLGKKWSIDTGGEIYPRLKDFSKVASINSTLLIEAMAFGLEVESYGNHAYTGYRLNNFDDRTKFLCAVLRHQIPYKATVEDLWENESFQKWVVDNDVPVVRP